LGVVPAIAETNGIGARGKPRFGADVFALWHRCF
jgi:hypothetical protein